MPAGRGLVLERWRVGSKPSTLRCLITRSRPAASSSLAVDAAQFAQHVVVLHVGQLRLATRHLDDGDLAVAVVAGELAHVVGPSVGKRVAVKDRHAICDVGDACELGIELCLEVRAQTIGDTCDRCLEERVVNQTQELCLLWIQWWPLCMSRSDWASWVQAIGTVAAIVFAVRVANVQWQRQQRERRVRDADRVAERFAPPITIATEAARELEELFNLRMTQINTPVASRYIHNDRVDERARDRLLRILQEVKCLDPLAMPSLESIRAVRQVVNSVQDAEQALQIVPNRTPISSAVEGMAATRFIDALQRIRDAKAALETEQARLSTPDQR